MPVSRRAAGTASRLRSKSGRARSCSPATMSGSRTGRASAQFPAPRRAPRRPPAPHGRATRPRRTRRASSARARAPSALRRRLSGRRASERARVLPGRVARHGRSRPVVGEDAVAAQRAGTSRRCLGPAASASSSHAGPRSGSRARTRSGRARRRARAPSPRLPRRARSERSTEIVVVGLEPRSPLRLVGSGKTGRGRPGDSRKCSGVRAPDVLRLAARLEHLDRVLADRLEHGEPLAVGAYEALVDERADRLEVSTAHVLDRLERAAAGEDRQPRKSACSSSPSRSKLQPIVSRSARCRSGASREPEVSSSSGCSSRARIPVGESIFTRAAASSIASGRQSRCSQISALAARSASSGENRGARLGPARGTRSRQRRGQSGSSGSSCSPPTRSRVRLVTTAFKFGLAATIAPSEGAASTTCSKLSTTSSSRRPRCAR